MRIRLWLREVVLFLPHMARLFGGLLLDARVPARAKWTLAAAAAYIASPIDIVPDVIPLAGQVDDLLVALVALDSVLSVVPPAIVAEHWKGDARTLTWARRVARVVRVVVPRRVRRLFGGAVGSVV